ncbi:hypothetical protein SDJN03_12639, partial [Cucurbita argyrosperma subsp. sororia]
MAAIKALLSIALIALLLFFESLPTSAAVHRGASTSLAGILRRNIVQTTADHHQVAEKKFNVHIKRRMRMRPVLIGRPKTSAANRSREAFCGVGSMLCIFVLLGLFL